MSIARFAVRVTVLTPFGNHPSRRPVSLLLLSKQFADVDVPEVNPHGAVNQAVNHGIGLDAAPEAAMPLGGRVLRAENRRLRGVAALYQLEQEGDVDIADVFGEPFVQYEDLVAGVLLQYLGVRALRGRELVALHEQVGQPHVSRALALPARLLGEAAGKVALPRARASFYDHVGC